LKKYLYALLILVIILPACQSAKPTVSNEPVMSLQPTFIATPTPVIIAKEIQAGFKEVGAARVIVKTELPKTYKELANHPIGQKGKIVFYEDTGDMIRYAYRTDKAFYPIGDIGEGHYFESISIVETKIFEKSLIRVKGDCGANCRMTDYLQIENSSVSSILFFGGDAAHIDLDQDGDLEILSRSSSTIPTINVVKLIGQQLMEVNVNEALKTEKGVLYDDKNQFFSIGVGDHMESYRLDPRGVFILEPTS
jgi:hypothetical protein